MINNSEGKLINMKCTQCSYNMIKNEENCFPVIASNENKIIFNISEIYSEIEYGTCLFFNKSIYPGNNECIEKPKNTFYVLRNEDNTGVIKNCSEICDTCLGEESPQNTNCINCIKGYYKTEDSDTHCILEKLIPNNYYLNKSDNIYYKCHPYCYNCSKGYDPILNNMNCLSCNMNLTSDKTFILYFFKLKNGNCIQECPDNLFWTN